MKDIRDELFRPLSGQRFAAALTAECAGILSGVREAQQCAQNIGSCLKLCKTEGAALSHGETFGYLCGTAKQIALAEEQLIGTLAKASGIATAARTAVELADGQVAIVSGAWKKMPPAVKDMVRRAIAAGGASFRICLQPMLYLDKNYIRMLGGIPEALRAASAWRAHTKVVQIRGMTDTVERETRLAIENGASLLMVDTGRWKDAVRCREEAVRLGRRGAVRIAYAGNVRLTDIPALAREDIDVLCIGKEIVDAQLLDMKLDVIGREQEYGYQFIGENRALDQRDHAG